MCCRDNANLVSLQPVLASRTDLVQYSFVFDIGARDNARRVAFLVGIALIHERGFKRFGTYLDQGEVQDLSIPSTNICLATVPQRGPVARPKRGE